MQPPLVPLCSRRCWARTTSMRAHTLCHRDSGTLMILLFVGIHLGEFTKMPYLYSTFFKCFNVYKFSKLLIRLDEISTWEKWYPYSILKCTILATTHSCRQ